MRLLERVGFFVYIFQKTSRMIISITLFGSGEFYLFYIDESGSIPKIVDTRFQHRYFVISFVHTEDSRKVSNVYKRAIRKMKADYPSFFANLPNPNEMKGSEMPAFMKAYLFETLFQSTDIKISHMVVNTVDIDDVFRQIPGRSFNYLIKLIIKAYPLSAADRLNLSLKIDNRNTAIKGLKELEGFLYSELVLGEKILKNVNVEYIDSKDSKLIQIADIVANTIYQRYRYKGMPFPNYSDISNTADKSHPYTYEYLYNLLRQKFVLPFVYPVSNKFISEVSSTYSL